MEDCWFLTHLLKVPGGLKVLHFKFQVSRMTGSPSRRPLSTISRLDPWRTDGSWHTYWRFQVACRCYISNFRCLGCQEAHQEGPYPPSPGWILGGLVVPDALTGGSWWSGGATFQISCVYNVRKPIKKAPIHHLQVGSLEDCWFLIHLLEVVGGLEPVTMQIMTVYWLEIEQVYLTDWLTVKKHEMQVVTFKCLNLFRHIGSFR